MSETNQVSLLDPMRLPLSQQRLIEASAGTGKTFTLGILYLRLLLGLGGSAAWQRLLSVEEILVVTFTEAATAELRGRIRDNIHQLRIACIRGETDKPMLKPLLAEIEDRQQAAALLLLAERQMDESAIYTIHGFCQRMLNLNAFESATLFQQQLVENEQALLRQAAEDFWRRYCYPLPEEIACEVVQLFSGPEHLLLALRGWLQGELPEIQPDPRHVSDLVTQHSANKARIQQMKQAWLAQVSEATAVIDNSDVDRRSYSTKNLPNWLALISAWAADQQSGYLVPKELAKFSQPTLLEKTKKGQPPIHPLFDAVAAFLSHPVSLYHPLVVLALREIRHSLDQEKRRNALLSFDDLLARLDQGLQQAQGEALAEAIRQRYPVAMIDEFQDTDPLQYRIFSRIYADQTQAAMLLIGDPKQAIYAFRGADIFTYIKARAEIEAHYSLQTNWRSSPGMVASVNLLFQRVNNPFLFAEIPFLPVAASPANQQLAVWRHGEQQPAMRWWLKEGEGCNLDDYQQTMANYCAHDIADWLTAGQQQEAWLIKGKDKRPVTAADITVLVRSRGEASIIRDALQQQGIASVYLSSRDSVYQTREAQELLWLLQAILLPQQERTLRTALATAILGFTASEIENLSQQSDDWDRLTEQFSQWQSVWRQAGFLPMLRQLMRQQALAENLLASPGGERRLTDLLHLGELLQTAAEQQDTPHALVRYLAQQIDQPDPQASSQQLRLESDRDLVKIVTIHKSKGLEYPLVWLPFIANFRKNKQPLYHDRQTFTAVLDLHEEQQSLLWAEEERLAEDLRLLYVAVTRSIWHCSLGIAPLFIGKTKYSGVTDLHKSAVGYLIQQGEQATAQQLVEKLAEMTNAQMALCRPQPSSSAPLQAAKAPSQALTSRDFTRSLHNEWRVTSYSALSQHTSHSGLQLPGFDNEVVTEQQSRELAEQTVHRFPKGAGPGTFLHHLFEQIEFDKPLEPSWVEEQLIAWGYDRKWSPIVHPWLQRVLTCPLHGSGACLNQLTSDARLVEMEFWIPIEKPLQPQRLDQLIRHYDPLSAQAPALNFKQVQGMLKGFIDLVFRWQGKYYILDYKSNWLGASSQDYTPAALSEAMLAHRYDLQYQLYSLALHRYLRHRLPNYHYETDFGGVYYLFLRGMADHDAENGVFFTRPSHTLIQRLDRQFRGEEQP